MMKDDVTGKGTSPTTQPGQPRAVTAVATIATGSRPRSTMPCSATT